MSRDREPSQADRLVELAESRYDLGVSDEGQPFAVAAGSRVALLLRGAGSLRAELAAAYAAKYGTAPSSRALSDALLVVEGRALQAEQCRQLHLRVARRDDPAGPRVWLDLGRVDEQVVEITADGWRVVAGVATPLWRRTQLTAPLPVPLAGGGDLAALRDLVAVSDVDWPLVVAWLVQALVEPETPHPVLALLGEAGTGKSTRTRILAAVLDPAAGRAQLRRVPRDPDQWITAAAGSYIVGIDNLSVVSPWLSDAMCRAVTGDGDVRRRLYSDGDLYVVAFRRVIAVNGIDLGALRGDLADRLLRVELLPVPDHRRRLDADLAEAWPRTHPAALAGVLDLAARVLATLPTVRLTGYPRMADYARILAAVDVVLGTQGLAAYLGQRDALAVDVVDGDLVAAALRDWTARLASGWEGTAGELLAALPAREPPPREWPRTARGMAGHLVRVAPALRRIGVSVQTLPRRRDGSRPWYITRIRPSSPSSPSSDGADQGGCDDGRVEPMTVDRHHRHPTVITPHTADQGLWPGNDGDDGDDGRIPTTRTHPREAGT